MEIREILKQETVKDLVLIMPQDLKIKLTLLLYRDVRNYTWGQIYIKLGCITENGKPDKVKGSKYRMLYYRIKQKNDS